MVSKYEAARLQRMEENKKRMEYLKLNSLALSFKNSRMVQKRLEFVEVRRSSRNVDKPKPVYKEVLVFEYESATRRNHSRPRGGLRENFPVACEKERAIATETACEMEMELSIGNDNNNFPSFVKPMLHSHVNRGFWLGLSNRFCKRYLPKRVTNYLAKKVGLSGGWRGFSLDHQLIDGDACVFQLTKPTQFKQPDPILKFERPTNKA
ncbi:hypothetical protein MKX03_015829 [Papaver bracteatum]|nr:hypothetical protein MKX03_015829 [Papaver bracteatum]